MTGALPPMRKLRAFAGVVAGSSSPERIGESVDVGRIRLAADQARKLDEAFLQGAIDGVRDAPGFLKMLKR